LRFNTAKGRGVDGSAEVALGRGRRESSKYEALDLCEVRVDARVS